MFSLSVELAADREAAWREILVAVRAALRRSGMEIEWVVEGPITQNGEVIGRVWECSGEQVSIEWHAAPWLGEAARTAIELRAEQIRGGTRITFTHSGLHRVFGDADFADWFGSELGAAFFDVVSPRSLGDWITDRKARRPSGSEARGTYADPLYHYPNFRVILAELNLQPNDYLVEIGCGGGALLRTALASGCRAAAIDHSVEMVELARHANDQAMAEHRVSIVAASAEQVPFADQRFTAATMTGVLGFLPDPVRAFSEVRRVLRPGGRFVALGSDVELRGTPGAPEPFASRLHFYSESELAALAHAAGFSSVRVVRRNLEEHAREVGVPEEHIPLFAGPGTTFLLANR